MAIETETLPVLVLSWWDPKELWQPWGLAGAGASIGAVGEAGASIRALMTFNGVNKLMAGSRGKGTFPEV